MEILFYARGGQGAVTAAHLLAEAAFRAGKRVQAQPFFGAERRGAPVYALTRISDDNILTRTRSVAPDVLVILDPSLLETGVLTKGRCVVANTKLSCADVATMYPHASKVATANLTKIAIELGLVVAGFPVVNTAVLGSLIKATRMFELNYIVEAVRSKWSGELGEKNVKAVIRAYDETTVEVIESS